MQCWLLQPKGSVQHPAVGLAGSCSLTALPFPSLPLTGAAVPTCHGGSEFRSEFRTCVCMGAPKGGQEAILLLLRSKQCCLRRVSCSAGLPHRLLCIDFSVSREKKRQKPIRKH